MEVCIKARPDSPALLRLLETATGGINRGGGSQCPPQLPLSSTLCRWTLTLPDQNVRVGAYRCCKYWGQVLAKKSGFWEPSLRKTHRHTPF
ncbi:unnamed protein product [Meloidogyne enterolobii]|uniref:Uncharacterized protein n=1 Tax=Meloidogyne enterolobii TaxID=390850 RepID=A0ACB0Y5Y3_MELEN